MVWRHIFCRLPETKEPREWRREKTDTPKDGDESLAGIGHEDGCSPEEMLDRHHQPLYQSRDVELIPKIWFV
jgi:uncharacterized protein (DUF2225 family)